MKVTAKEFRDRPEKVYRAADKGEPVIINHDRYKDKIFNLTARERGAEFDLEVIEDE